jgi:hypothetical protein
MNKTKGTFITLALLLTIVATPLSAKALTTSDLQAQIQNLMQILTQLQQQVAQQHTTGQIQQKPSTTFYFTTQPHPTVVTENSATITWALNMPATGSLRYGNPVPGTVRLPEENSLKFTSHIQTIYGLKPCTGYAIQVSSRNVSGIIAMSKVSNIATKCSSAVSVQAGQCTPPHFYRTIWSGLRGSDVSELQRYLKTQGFYTYPEITGYYGPATLLAVQDFQRAKSIVSYGTPSTTGYGVVGPATRAKMVCDKVSGNTSSLMEMRYPESMLRHVKLLKTPLPLQDNSAINDTSNNGYQDIALELQRVNGHMQGVEEAMKVVDYIDIKHPNEAEDVGARCSSFANGNLQNTRKRLSNDLNRLKEWKQQLLLLKEDASKHSYFADAITKKIGESERYFSLGYRYKDVNAYTCSKIAKKFNKPPKVSISLPGKIIANHEFTIKVEATDPDNDTPLDVRVLFGDSAFPGSAEYAAQTCSADVNATIHGTIGEVTLRHKVDFDVGTFDAPSLKSPREYCIQAYVSDQLCNTTKAYDCAQLYKE